MKLKETNGSVLVGVIVLSAVICIAAAGLLAMSRGTLSNEADSYDDAAAFLAAESGLSFGLSWLKQPGNTVDIDNLPQSIQIPSGAVSDYGKFDRINSLSVYIESGDATTNAYRVTSTAIHNELPYSKTLEWTVEVVSNHSTLLPSGHYGNFYDDLSNIKDQNGLNNIFFDGPLHSNTPIEIDLGAINTKGNDPFGRNNPPHSLYFNGPVTVYNNMNFPNYPNHIPEDARFYSFQGTPDATKGNFSQGLISPKTGNNYKDVTYSDIGGLFNSTYDGNANPMFVHFNKGNIITHTYRHGGDLTAGTPTHDESMDVVISASANEIIFGVNATGPYYQIGGKTVNYERNKPLIITAEFPLVVKSATGSNIAASSEGTMLGRVTVNTTSNNDITIDLPSSSNTFANTSNLVYGTGINANRTVPNNDIEKNFGLLNEDILAFYSGKDINIKRGKSSGQINYITAQLFARNGTLNIDLGSSGNDGGRIVHVIGSVCAKIFYDGKGNKLSDNFQVFHDRRTTTDDQGNTVALSAPGLGYSSSPTGGGGGNNNISLIKSNWRETNCATGNSTAACASITGSGI